MLTCYGVISAAISLALRGTVHNLNLSSGQNLTHTQIVDIFAIVLPSLLVIAALGFVTELILTGLLTVVIGRGVLGHKVSMGEAWRIALPRLPAILGAIILIALCVIAPWVAVAVLVVILAVVHATAAAVIVGVVGGIAALYVSIWFPVMFSLAAPAVVLERQGPARSLAGSWRLVRQQLLAGVLDPAAGRAHRADRGRRAPDPVLAAHHPGRRLGRFRRPGRDRLRRRRDHRRRRQHRRGCRRPGRSAPG